MPVHMSYSLPRTFLAGIHPGWVTHTPLGSAWVRVTGQIQSRKLHKTRDCKRKAGHFSCVPLRCCSPPRHPVPVKSLALSTCVSLWTIHFQMLEDPTVGLGKGCPFLQHSHISITWEFTKSADSQALPQIQWVGVFILTSPVTHIRAEDLRSKQLPFATMSFQSCLKSRKWVGMGETTLGGKMMRLLRVPCCMGDTSFLSFTSSCKEVI